MVSHTFRLLLDLCLWTITERPWTTGRDPFSFKNCIFQTVFFKVYPAQIISGTDIFAFDCFVTVIGDSNEASGVVILPILGDIPANVHNLFSTDNHQSHLKAIIINILIMRSLR